MEPLRPPRERAAHAAVGERDADARVAEVSREPRAPSGTRARASPRCRATPPTSRRAWTTTPLIFSAESRRDAAALDEEAELPPEVAAAGVLALRRRRRLRLGLVDLEELLLQEGHRPVEAVAVVVRQPADVVARARAADQRRRDERSDAPDPPRSTQGDASRHACVASGLSFAGEERAEPDALCAPSSPADRRCGTRSVRRGLRGRDGRSSRRGGSRGRPAPRRWTSSIASVARSSIASVSIATRSTITWPGHDATSARKSRLPKRRSTRSARPRGGVRVARARAILPVGSSSSASR